MMSIRTDKRQWLIYQEEPVVDVVSAIEAFLVGIGAAFLKNHEDIAMRGIGHFGEMLAQTRLTHMNGMLGDLESTEMQKELVEHLLAISGYLAGDTRPDEALDDIHAALVWLDKRAKGAGVSGPGWYREIVRESTLGR
jgi:hypothetical protein